MVSLIYSTGTVSVNPGDTTVVGVDTVWSNLRAFDWIAIDNEAPVPIEAVVDVTHLTIAAWQGAAKASVNYKAYMISPLRFEGDEQAADVARLVAALNTDGFYHFVPSIALVPDPSLGDEGQFAYQSTTGKMWLKELGTWNFIGVYKGFGLPRPWDNVTAFQPFDVATLNGTSYVAIAPNTNQSPPNATYWVVLAAKGEIGNTGPTGPGYGGTSTTSLTIGTGSRVFTTQTGMAYQVGTRIRAASAANPSNYMEGIVTAYGGTFLTANISRINGAGTLADWMLSVAGDPGSGDMLSTNNLSDLANSTTAKTNLGLGAGNSPQFTGIELGHATDTTVSRPAAGRMQVEGEEVLTTKTLGGILTATQKRQALQNVAPFTRVITGAASIGLADHGKTIFLQATSAFTVTIDALATLFDGWWCRIKNIDVGLVTIDANGSETIDSALTTIVPKNDSFVLTCNSGYFFTLDRPAIVLLESAAKSGAASYDLALPPGYDELELAYRNFRPASDGNQLLGRISTDGGSTFATSAYYYGGGYGISQTPGGAMDTVGNNAGQFIINGTTESDASGGGTGFVRFNSGDGSEYRRILFQYSGMLADGRGIFGFGGGFYGSPSAWTHFR